MHTEKIGRLTRNIVNTFVLRHKCGSDTEEKEYTFEQLIKHMVNECNENEPAYCPHSKCE